MGHPIAFELANRLIDIAPKGYLQKLREITKKHDILLIFDEVITGFGRLGAAFAA